VHQCAQFSTSPTRAHKLAAKRIVRYLKGTRSKGYILRPGDTIDCYVDADLSRAWTIDTSADPSSVRARTRYVITYAYCPILWCSKLQTEAALSTTEVECISLSQSLQDLIPMRTIIQELSQVCNISSQEATTYSTMFEDNKGCVDLTYYAPLLSTHLHQIPPLSGACQSWPHQNQMVSTLDQLADIFTKPLPLSKFVGLRQTLLGWWTLHTERECCRYSHRLLQRYALSLVFEISR
jgi:hypothetical protein